MERVRIRKLTVFGALTACLFLVGGCYHLRLVPAPLEKARVVTTKGEREALDTVATVLKEDGFGVEFLGGEACATSAREFYIERGAGQPVDGRHYFYRLRVSLLRAETANEVVLEPFELAIESTYVFDSDGSLARLSKRYPYEVYPGMFDLASVQRELDRVKGLLQRNL